MPLFTLSSFYFQPDQNHLNKITVIDFFPYVKFFVYIRINPVVLFLYLFIERWVKLSSLQYHHPATKWQQSAKTEQFHFLIKNWVSQ